jgi:hypothetical protein
MLNPFWLPIELVRGNGLNIYLSPRYMVRLPKKAKTSPVKGWRKREMTVLGTPKVVGLELLQVMGNSCLVWFKRKPKICQESVISR